MKTNYDKETDPKKKAEIAKRWRDSEKKRMRKVGAKEKFAVEKEYKDREKKSMVDRLKDEVYPDKKGK